MRAGLLENKAWSCDGESNEPSRSKSKCAHQRNGCKAGRSIHKNRLPCVWLDLKGQRWMGNWVDESKRSNADLQSIRHTHTRQGHWHGNKSQGDGRTSRQHVNPTGTKNAWTRSNELSLAEPSSDGKASVINKNKHQVGFTSSIQINLVLCNIKGFPWK